MSQTVIIESRFRRFYGPHYTYTHVHTHASSLPGAESRMRRSCCWWKMEVDDALLKLGKFNRWRIATYCMVCCSVTVTGCWHMMAIVFVGKIIRWCIVNMVLLKFTDCRVNTKSSPTPCNFCCVNFHAKLYTHCWNTKKCRGRGYYLHLSGRVTLGLSFEDIADILPRQSGTRHECQCVDTKIATRRAKSTKCLMNVQECIAL